MPAGHSVVAFATGAHADVPFAAKFFAERAPFDTQLAAHRIPALGKFVPQILYVHDPAAVDPNSCGNTDRFGRLLAPCIVMPRGESLVQWSKRAVADKFQAITVRLLADPA